MQLGESTRQLAAKEAKLTAEEARGWLAYNKRTGSLVWKRREGDAHFNANHAGKVAGYVNNCGYRAIMLKRVTYTAHRLAWLIVHGRWPCGALDHKNTKRDDNRLRNLREGAHTGNMSNRAGWAISGVKNVTTTPEGRYIVKVIAKGVYHYGGTFGSLKAAKAKAAAMRVALHGNFANHKHVPVSLR